MSIVATRIDAVIGSERRSIYYACQDDTGVWHQYGPVITTDQNFDAEAHKTVVAAKVGAALAEAEASRLLE